MPRRTALARPLARHLLPSLCLVAPGAALADDWPAYQHDVAHTGRSSASFNPVDMVKAWTAPANYSTPLVVGNLVVATRNAQGGGAPTLYSSFDLADGSANWTVSHNFTFPSQATVGEGLVVYAGEDSTTRLNRLYVRDLASGALKYSVPLATGTGGMPTIHREASSGRVSAYHSSNGLLTAITLGEDAGTVRWTGLGSFGNYSIPTIAGESVIVAGPAQFYAFRQTDGTRNQFFRGSGIGGGGTTPAFDAARNRLYVLETRGGDPIGASLTAFDYAANDSITERWVKTGTGIGGGASVAIGADGKLYSVDNFNLAERDPNTGEVVRSLPGQSFANASTPALMDGYLWTMGNFTTDVYDLATFTRVDTYAGSRGSLNSAFDSAGAIANGHFLLDYGNIVGRPGFDVYRAVPEPGTPACCVAAASLLLFRGDRRKARPHGPEARRLRRCEKTRSGRILQLPLSETTCR